MTQVSRKGFRDKNGKQVVIDPKVPGATSGNLASFDENGDLQDSGKKPADFALADHQHDSIKTGSSFSSGAVVGTGITLDDNPVINLGLVKRTLGNTNSKRVNITLDNIDNLNRALKNPSSKPENDANKLITSKAVYDALLGKMDALKEIFIDCDDSGSSDTWEIHPDDAGEAAFRDALVWGDNAPRLVIVTIKKGTDGTTNHKTYRTIGSIHATSVEVSTDDYELTAEIYVDGHIFKRTGEEFNQETTWGVGLTLEADDIFTHVSNS